jgi:hypothetical protein
VSAVHAKRNDLIGGRDQGCGSHDTPLSHMEEGSAFVGVVKVADLGCSSTDEMQSLRLR